MSGAAAERERPPRAYAAAYAAAGRLASEWLRGRQRMLPPSRRAGEDARRIRERLGAWDAPVPDGRWIWLHGASVGEVAIAAAIARDLGTLLPGRAFVLTSQTTTGQGRARELHPGPCHYFPLDYLPVLEKVVRPRPPELFVSVETEIWPRLLALLGDHGAVTAMASARVSDRSMPRYRWARPLLAPVLRRLAWVGARDEVSAARLIELGARDASLEITGDLKLDVASARSGDETTFLQGRAPEAPLLVAGSTHAGEEEVVLAAFERVRQRLPRAALVLVPRHPERGGDVAALAAARGLTVARWSGGRAREMHWDVLVVDAIGHLAELYGCARAAFVGGSLVAGPGGHNLLEPVRLGVPVASGRRLENVMDQRDLLSAAGGLTLVEDSAALAAAWIDMLENRSSYDPALAAARAAIAERGGALARTVARLAELVERRG